jgi:hypothetical protein
MLFDLRALDLDDLVGIYLYVYLCLHGSAVGAYTTDTRQFGAALCRLLPSGCSLFGPRGPHRRATRPGHRGVRRHAMAYNEGRAELPDLIAAKVGWQVTWSKEGPEPAITTADLRPPRSTPPSMPQPPRWRRSSHSIASSGTVAS